MRIDNLSLMLSSKKRGAPSSAAVNWPHGSVTLIYITEDLTSPGEVRTPRAGHRADARCHKAQPAPPQRWRKTPRAIKEASGRARPSEASTGCPPARRAALLVRPRELVWSASRGEGERRAGGRLPKLHPCPREDRLVQLRPPLSSLLSLLAAPKEPQRLGTLWQEILQVLSWQWFMQELVTAALPQ